mgnify:CR=1 FL=1
MKKYKNIIFAVVCIFIIILLYVLGFRITYNPEIINDWDAVSGCAAWASVFVSGLAIYYAIQVPKKIAEDQNKIALFEKRYEIYEVITNCVNIAIMIKRKDELNNAKITDFLITNKFTNNFIPESSIDENIKYSVFSKISNKLEQTQFLFDDDSAEEIEELSNKLREIYIDSKRLEKHKEKVKEYIKQALSIQTQTLKAIRKELELK